MGQKGSRVKDDGPVFDSRNFVRAFGGVCFTLTAKEWVSFRENRKRCEPVNYWSGAYKVDLGDYEAIIRQVRLEDLQRASSRCGAELRVAGQVRQGRQLFQIVSWLERLEEEKRTGKATEDGEDEGEEEAAAVGEDIFESNEEEEEEGAERSEGSENSEGCFISPEIEQASEGEGEREGESDQDSYDDGDGGRRNRMAKSLAKRPDLLTCSESVETMESSNETLLTSLSGLGSSQGILSVGKENLFKSVPDSPGPADSPSPLLLEASPSPAPLTREKRWSIFRWLARGSEIGNSIQAPKNLDQSVGELGEEEEEDEEISEEEGPEAHEAEPVPPLVKTGDNVEENGENDETDNHQDDDNDNDDEDEDEEEEEEDGEDDGRSGVCPAGSRLLVDGELGDVTSDHEESGENGLTTPNFSQGPKEEEEAGEAEGEAGGAGEGGGEEDKEEEESRKILVLAREADGEIPEWTERLDAFDEAVESGTSDFEADAIGRSPEAHTPRSHTPRSQKGKKAGERRGGSKKEKTVPGVPSASQKSLQKDYSEESSREEIRSALTPGKSGRRPRRFIRGDDGTGKENVTSNTGKAALSQADSEAYMEGDLPEESQEGMPNEEAEGKEREGEGSKSRKPLRSRLKEGAKDAGKAGGKAGKVKLTLSPKIPAEWNNFDLGSDASDDSPVKTSPVKTSPVKTSPVKTSASPYENVDPEPLTAGGRKRSLEFDEPGNTTRKRAQPRTRAAAKAASQASPSADASTAKSPRSVRKPKGRVVVSQTEASSDEAASPTVTAKRPPAPSKPAASHSRRQR